jgi:hypothetical protein
MEFICPSQGFSTSGDKQSKGIAGTISNAGEETTTDFMKME